MDSWSMLTTKNHTEQGIWWLNGFWTQGAEDEAENIWEMVHLMIELENGEKKLYGSKAKVLNESCDIDQMQAHHFLERRGNTLTVVALRQKLKDLDIDNNKRMCLSEYLLAHYSKGPTELIDSPQGGQAGAEELAAAQAGVANATALLSTAVADAEASAAAAAAAKAASDASEAAKAELAAAVADLEAQEKAIADKKAGFQAIIDDEGKSSMKRNMAKNELAQMEAEDPLPLRKAKITQKAALKKADKAAKKAAEELAAAEAAEAKAAEAKAEAEQAFKDAEQALQDLKAKGDGIARGAIWWMERELAERKKFMPGSRR